MERSKVSLKTLADELNLSMTTISRALRNCSDIGEKTKQRIFCISEIFSTDHCKLCLRCVSVFEF